ncbi:MAG: TatD family hydrolase [Deltaproteobacteria bacterium]|nr:TatD family hydrolase [Deltaproteobacteria bacterium]
MPAKNSPTFFDTHIHLEEFDPRCGELAAARAAGIGYFLVPGVAPQGWDQILALARAESAVWAAPGIHPLAADQWNDETARRLRELLAEPKAAAVGEIGLDRMRSAPPHAIQEKAFRAQLRLAAANDLPVLIHCRKAWRRTLDILREEGAHQCGGILHSFSGSLEIALEGISLGFVIAFGGPLTYPNARRIPEVLKGIPDQAIVLETDAPDLSPEPYRGHRNRPLHLLLIARKVAAIRGWTLERTAAVTTANALRILPRMASREDQP